MNDHSAKRQQPPRSGTLTRTQNRKRLPLGKRIQRFFFGKRFLTVLLATLLCVITLWIGFSVYAAICSNGAKWEEITSPLDDTIPTNTTVQPGPFGDGFLADLSQYEDYINPIGDKRDAFLRLVTAKTPLKRGDTPDDLTSLRKEITWEGREITLSLHAAKALEAMLIEMNAQGIEPIDPATKLPIGVLIGFRSYDEQKKLFDAEVQRQMRRDPNLSIEMATDIASAIVDKPGANEHQSGLAVAFASGNAVSSAFADTEMYEWLTENAWKFGFILRYPEGKEAETGIAFRPYHFRYVGRAHASLMKEHDLCLEEYLKVVILN